MIYMKKVKNKVEPIKIVFAGYISESKGQMQLINAIELLEEKERKRISLDIIGTGKKEYIDEMKKYILKNNLENIIHLLGYKENIRELLPSYDIGMMCSKSEGFGRTTAEYMATGLITIASNTGANLELIEENMDGFIYEYNNINQLKNTLVYVLDNYQNLKDIGKNARNKIYSKFNAKINVDNLIKEYNRNEEK